MGTYELCISIQIIRYLIHIIHIRSKTKITNVIYLGKVSTYLGV